MVDGWLERWSNPNGSRILGLESYNCPLPPATPVPSCACEFLFCSFFRANQPGHDLNHCVVRFYVHCCYDCFPHVSYRLAIHVVQDGVPQSIRTLRRAGMKVWMLTGDKYSTALQIAVSCNITPPPGESETFDAESRFVASVSMSDSVMT